MLRSKNCFGPIQLRHKRPRQEYDSECDVCAVMVLSVMLSNAKHLFHIKVTAQQEKGVV